MTTSQLTDKIYNILKILAPRYEIKCYSAIIGQSLLESNYGKSVLSSKYNNYFGMKCGKYWNGTSVNLKTKEEYTDGTIVNISDNFRTYSSIELGVKGYLDFISTKRYSNLKNVTEPSKYLALIKSDGYATDSKYVDKVMNIIKTYNLQRYDTL